MADRTTPGTKVTLTIADSDPSGGVGIQADLKTFAAMGVYGAAVVTAITVQNTTGVKEMLPVDPHLAAKQIDAVASDIDVLAVKTGLLPTPQIIQAVAKTIERHSLYPLVVDPAIVNKNGDTLIEHTAVTQLCRRLLPLAAVATPNRLEVALMLGRSEPVKDLYAAKNAAVELCRTFKLRACIVKGLRRPNGHEGEAVDLFFDGEKERELVSDWRPTNNTRGSGSTFSAAITAALALGQKIDEAAQTAKVLVSEAIRQTTDLGKGISPVNPLAYATVSS